MKSLISNINNIKNQKSHTIKEIVGQPNLWDDTFNKILDHQKEIKKFLENQNVYANKKTKIILTGAGSSAFIGKIARFSFKISGFKNTCAIPTTDLVTHFREIVDTHQPTLFISFARSGNSPESEAVVNLANNYCDEVNHLIVTCNKNGKLARQADSKNAFVFVLPSAAEDKGLAMTGSFSSMVLVASLIADLPNINKYRSPVLEITQIGKKILKEYIDILRLIAEKKFNRIIFLGDGPNLGCAQESHLKVQELTDGICIGKFDSFLGFRHGPKAVVDKNSLLIYLLSNKDSVIRYQLDLAKQISARKLGMHSLAIGNTKKICHHVDTNIYLPELFKIPEFLLPVPYILIAQIIGFFKSEVLSLDPDNPSKNGAISRVVEGVTIYDDLSKNGTPKTQ